MKVTATQAYQIGELAADVFSREVPAFWGDDALNALSGFAMENIGNRGQPDTLDRFVAEIMGQSGQVDEVADNLEDDEDGATKIECKLFCVRVEAAIKQHRDEFEKGVRTKGEDILEGVGWLPD